MTITRINPASTYTRVKGDSESSYRTGDVNLTPANIGAALGQMSSNGAGTSAATVLSSNTNNTRLELVYDKTNNRFVIDAYENSAWKGRIDLAYWNGNPNYVLASPASGTGITTYRKLVQADIPWVGTRDVRYANSSTDYNATMSVPSSAWTKIAQISNLPAGNYIFIGKAHFASNSTGVRGVICKVGTAAPNGAEERMYDISLSAANGGTTGIISATCRELTASDSFTVWVWQNSGSALNCYATATYMRIK